MRVLFLAVCVAGSIGFVACSDEATPSDTSSTDGGTADTGSSSGDGGGERAPSGCLLTTTGFMSGAKAESVARADAPNGAAWANVDDARAADGKFATVTLGDGQESELLRVSDFKFAIPAGAETWGIEVELKRQAPDGGVVDDRVDVAIENKTSRYKLMTTPWPASALGTHAYGQAVDTWGMDVVPADFNRSDFAALLAVKRVDGAVGPVTGIVDSLRVAVHYCPEPAKK